jgi:hypothetical protein
MAPKRAKRKAASESDSFEEEEQADAAPARARGGGEAPLSTLSARCTRADLEAALLSITGSAEKAVRRAVLSRLQPGVRCSSLSCVAYLRLRTASRASLRQSSAGAHFPESLFALCELFRLVAPLLKTCALRLDC